MDNVTNLVPQHDEWIFEMIEEQVKQESKIAYDNKKIKQKPEDKVNMTCILCK